MSNRIFIITVFISNIAFGGVLPKINLQGTVNTKSADKLTAKVSTQLFKRGLDKKIAKTKVKHSLVHDDILNDLMAKNVLKNIPSLTEEHIIDFITQAALQEKTVDLSSYATLISLVQKYATAQFDSALCFHVEQASLENERLKSMKVCS
jgi:hypothetical protein